MACNREKLHYKSGPVGNNAFDQRLLQIAIRTVRFTIKRRPDTCVVI